MDVSDIFYFFCLGKGKWESGATGRGGVGRFLLKITEGGSFTREGGGRGGREGVCGDLGGGGGLKYFFSGRNSHQDVIQVAIRPLMIWQYWPKKRGRMLELRKTPDQLQGSRTSGTPKFLETRPNNSSRAPTRNSPKKTKIISKRKPENTIFLSFFRFWKRVWTWARGRIFLFFRGVSRFRGSGSLWLLGHVAILEVGSGSLLSYILGAAINLSSKTHAHELLFFLWAGDDSRNPLSTHTSPP